MDDVLGYDGASVVVTGAASGMGAAAAQILVDLGARVTALDIKPTTVPVTRSLEVDLRDRAAIEAAAAAVDGPVDGLFSCAGLPGPPFSELDTMTVNFVGRPPPGRADSCRRCGAGSAISGRSPRRRPSAGGTHDRTGPTDTAMMPAFQDFATKEVVDQAVGPIGRYARPEEQAWPLVMLGSPR